ncbi:MAG: hypothetical protein FGM32_00220 [Candidatus Kapabacteria bacterium]|nr:hypothetical protein [Candidatus Kapabacteria bacterium]
MILGSITIRLAIPGLWLLLWLGTTVHVRAQVPLYTRELHIQHNGSGSSLKITLPTLSSSYSLAFPSGQGASGSVLSNDGTGNLSWTSALSSIGSSGSSNYIPMFTSSSTVANSSMYQNGTSVGLGNTVPGARLHVTIDSAAKKGLIIRGAALASANLLELQDNTGASVFQVSSNGDLSRIRNVSYTWPTALPAVASTNGTQLGEAVASVNSSGTISWRQLTVASATLDFPITATRTSSDLTITVNGAATGDMVVVGVPNAAVLINSCYTGWVSADNTVTVRFNNYDNAEKNPASATFKVTVIK